jgi:D-serine deaminase-like pyridoxal phosphate-dependent protein
MLLAEKLPVPKIVAGGTGSFPIFAQIEDPALELSPGTPVLYDAGYSHMFPDLEFSPAALLLTRVISLPGSNRLTLDLGYKAVASDPPLERRAFFPTLPDAKLVGQSEEHLMLETSEASKFSLGDPLLAVPWHVCPTTALHRELIVIKEGEVLDRWQVTARDRRISI